MGIISKEELKHESEQAAKRGKTYEKMVIKWGSLGDKTELRILPPWREEGLPWYTIGVHANLPGRFDKIKCPESVPRNYRPEGWEGYCPICEMKRSNSLSKDEFKAIAPLWMRHNINCFIDKETEVSVLGLPTMAKDELVTYLEEGDDFTEPGKIIRVVKKIKNGNTTYKTLFVKSWSDWKEPQVEIYDLDKVFEFNFSSQNIEFLRTAAEDIARKTRLKVPWLKSKSVEEIEDEEEVPVEAPAPAKKAVPSVKKIPKCYGDYKSPVTGLSCETCSYEVPCRMKSKKAAPSEPLEPEWVGIRKLDEKE